MQQIDFNKTWTFYVDGDEQNKGTVNLPHDAQIREARSPDLCMDSGFFPGGKYIYVKNYSFPNEFAEQEVYLEFDGVYMNAEVLVNGQSVGFQPYGYTNFIVPIHKHIKVGENNEIKVVADNSKFPNARWYTGSGIYRNVVLHVGAKKHIPPYGIKIDTLDYKPAKIAISIDVPDTQDCTVKTDIIFDGEIIASTSGFKSEINIPDAQLWSDEHPNLYTANVQLLHNGTVIDEAKETFGIRKIEWDVSYGLKINGNVTLLRGGCIHHDNGVLGAAAYTDAEDRKVRILKEAGFNALRSSHNVCSKAMLDACDKYGMYMMDEFADMWTQHKHKHDYATQFKEWYEKDLTAMVTKDYNHPSVIMYSIGNEVGESATPEGLDYARKMTDLLHRLDGSRPVTCGINILLNGLVSMGKGLYQDEGRRDVGSEKNDKKGTSGSTFINGVMSRMGSVINLVGRMKKFDQASKDIFGILDIAGYNYASGRYKVDPKQYPERITVGSETLPPSLYKNWEAVKKYPNLVGDFMWTAWDYIGEAGLGAMGYGDNSGVLKEYPMILSGCGIIDITGECRPEVYWTQCIWGLRDKPYLAVDPLTHAGQKATPTMWRNTDATHSWAWPGYEGRKTTVTVYASAYKVKLLLDGRKIVSKRVKACKAVFRGIEYIPGELKAIAYDASGQIVGEDILRSADRYSVLKISPEQEVFTSGKLLYTNIYLTDKKGTRVFSADKKVKVNVEGGILLGLGSASATTEESYLDDEYTTYNGKVQAVIMPDSDSDTVTITAIADNIEGDSITIYKK